MNYDDIQCLINLTGINGLGQCLITTTGGWLGIAIYYGLLFAIIGGWMIQGSPGKGLMIGGFFGILIGFGMWVLEYISIGNVFISLALMLIGIVITVLTK